MTLLCSVVQLCTVSTLPYHQAIGSALDSPKASNKEQLEISEISRLSPNDNTFKSQYGQGNPRGAPRHHQNKNGMETVGLKAQLQSNLFEDLEYQKVKLSTGTGALRRTSNFMSDVDSKRVNSSAILNSSTDCEMRQNSKQKSLSLFDVMLSAE
ncbi:hypothetical protein RRG08_021255 [Elysia crispata]|uniref:Uncharacterized protein n=1 Tax=Elysia crispata TaxID=231223 RepID=A0AAE0YU12_9GAST|nr:hypothetical protein RRG08_021255 [Elysia crispata]